MALLAQVLGCGLSGEAAGVAGPAGLRARGLVHVVGVTVQAARVATGGIEAGNDLALDVDDLADGDSAIVSGLGQNLGLTGLLSPVSVNAEGVSTPTDASQVVYPVVSWGQGRLLDSYLLDGGLGAVRPATCWACLICLRLLLVAGVPCRVLVCCDPMCCYPNRYNELIDAPSGQMALMACERGFWYAASVFCGCAIYGIRPGSYLRGMGDL